MWERARVATVALAALLPGCGYALLQTAHTEPPDEHGAILGASKAANDISDEKGRTGYGGELSFRLGFTDHLDVGVSSWFAPGVKLDGKYNLLAPKQALAIAPRLGVGYASSGSDESAALAFAGGIASYRLAPWLEPYFGASFANHWIERPTPEDEPLLPNESYAERTGTGDGLIQLATGIEIRGNGFGFIAEYGLWLPANNDPGDFYKFLTTHVFALGMHFF